MIDLNQHRVLVTRPEEQASHFLDMIEANNGSAINFPTITIAASPLTDEAKQQLKNLSQINIAIFVSVNAVNYGLMALKSLKLKFPETLIVAAVGQATAEALTSNEIQVDIVPDDNFSSEGLLATPELEEIAGENILIFRGQYGRELLSVELTKRYANVDTVECYQRVIPEFDVKPTVKELKAGSIDVVTITSASGLNNLFEMLGENSDLLLDLPFVVASRRIAEECENFEIKNINVADNAGDKAMLEAVSELANQTEDDQPDEEEEEEYL